MTIRTSGRLSAWNGKYKLKRVLLRGLKMSEKREQKSIEILQHTISYWYDNDQDMPEHEQEHVQEMIIEGYNSGELNDGTETETNSGWWSIEP